MDQAVLNSMTAAEQRLVAETSREAMAALDEEELLALHSRIGRAQYVCHVMPGNELPRSAATIFLPNSTHVSGSYIASKRAYLP